MTVRSRVLFRRLLALDEDGSIVATVPAGHTWLIKDVLARLEGAGSTFVELYVTDIDSVRGFLLSQTLGYLAPAHFVGSVVAEAGMYLAYTSNGGPVAVWISGSDLLL